MSIRDLAIRRDEPILNNRYDPIMMESMNGNGRRQLGNEAANGESNRA